ncbi:MAG: cupin domain-containing protein [Omnitrophica WOR_2 bacterium]
MTKPIPEQKPDVERVTRPWGSFAQYAHNQEVTVSLMTVEPGQRLSLQAHTGRGELWIVLDEGVSIQVGEQVTEGHPGDEFWIPANTSHRLTSLGRRGRVLEVAFGNWQQEDVLRFADDYQRPEQGE